MTRSRETEALLEAPHGSVGKPKGRPRWAAKIKTDGIDPDNETANMWPSDVSVYQQLSEKKPVTIDKLAKALRPDAEYRRARASVTQGLIRLGKILPDAVNKSVVNVGAPGHAAYLLVEVGQEQKAIERYARERERRATEEAERQRQAKEALAPKTVLLSHLPLGVAILSNELSHMMYPNVKVASAREQTSHLIRRARKYIEPTGETILGIWTKDGKYVYVRTQIVDAERIRAEIRLQRPTHRTPKVRAIMAEGVDRKRGRPRKEQANPPTSQEIALEEGVETNIVPLDNPEELYYEEPDEELDKEEELSFKKAPTSLRTTEQRVPGAPQVSLEGSKRPNIPFEDLFGIAVILRAPMRKIEDARTRYGIIVLPTHICTINEIMAGIMTDEERKSAQSRFASEIFTQAERRVIDYLTNRDSYKRFHDYEKWMLRWFNNMTTEQAGDFFSTLRGIFQIN